MNKFKARTESSIYNIRTFHNLIKRNLITESVNFLRQEYQKTSISLLDLSCGKGGDQAKWFDNGIMKVVGFDIDEPSINEAKKRYNELLKTLRYKRVQNLPDYKFYVMDLSDKNNIEKVNRILGDNRFDIVSCQFAIHYFFRSAETLNTFMTIASEHAALDSFFIGTTMNGNKIRELFKTGSTLQNSIYKITNNTNTFETPYNNKYTVALGEKTDTEHYFAQKDSVEYLVDIEELKKVADKFGFLFIGTTEFNEWYNKLNFNKLTDDDKEFSFLNFSFVFKSKRN